jgi:hypothetical protein
MLLPFALRIDLLESDMGQALALVRREKMTSEAWLYSKWWLPKILGIFVMNHFDIDSLPGSPRVHQDCRHSDPG